MITNSFKKLSVLAFIFFAAQSSYSKTFTNAYIAFDIDDAWDCNLQQTEYVCRSRDTKEGKEAVIIFTAKEKGPQDQLSLYQSHLDGPINSMTRSGQNMSSTVKYKSQIKRVNGQEWVDGLHQDSEVKNYFTRYLGTIKGNVAILLTFSAHNRYYSKYSSMFDRAVQSVAVKDTSNLIGPRSGTGGFAGNEIIGGAGADGGLVSLLEEESFGDSGFNLTTIIGIILVIVALLGGAFVWYYRKKKNE